MKWELNIFQFNLINFKYKDFFECSISDNKKSNKADNSESKLQSECTDSKIKQ